MLIRRQEAGKKSSWLSAPHEHRFHASRGVGATMGPQRPAAHLPVTAVTHTHTHSRVWVLNTLTQTPAVKTVVMWRIAFMSLFSENTVTASAAAAGSKPSQSFNGTTRFTPDSIQCASRSASTVVEHLSGSVLISTQPLHVQIQFNQWMAFWFMTVLVISSSSCVITAKDAY